MKVVVAFLAAFCTLASLGALHAQVIVIDQSRDILPRPPVPPRPPRPPRPWPVPPRVGYTMKSVQVQATIRDQTAQVQLSQVFKNTGHRLLEARLLFPMPDDGTISDLTLLVDGKELTGRLLKKEDARKIYEEIVRRRRDPALLEYLGHGLFQTSVFPVPPGASRTVQIRYSQFLRKENGLVDFLLPIGTIKHAHQPIQSLDATIRIESSGPLKTIYSPTHSVEITRSDAKHAVCKLSLKQIREPDDFRLLYGSQKGFVGMNLLSYKPKHNEDGYFLLLASPDLKPVKGEQLPKTIVFVLDRSGSMSGKKIEQSRDALRFLIEQLKPSDTFNIVAYDSDVESFRPELQKADASTREAARGFIDGLYAGGSTNIDSALQTAFSMLTDSSRPSYVLFLTDGLPTAGERNEFTIAEHVKDANRVAARLFSFGVGFDVNSRLLDRLSRGSRGQTIYVRPNEDIEAPIARLASRISSPLLTDLSVKIAFNGAASPAAPQAIVRQYPRHLPDLFRGEQLVLVGRYRQMGTAKITLTGMQSGKPKSFHVSATFAPKSSTETNAFIEKLWATRRVGEIIDELDLHGHNQELIDELVQLSLRHGIMTPYTSFLADEEVDLADRTNARRTSELVRRELSESSGVGGFLQREFKSQLRTAIQAPKPSDVALRTKDAHTAGNLLGAGRGTTASEPSSGRESQQRQYVRRVGPKTFYWKNQVWRDATVTVEQEKRAVPIVQFSPEYFKLAGMRGGLFAKYLAFSEPVLVQLDGKVYRIEPPEESR